MVRSRRGRSLEGRAEVRQELMTAAVALFRDRGYEDTTVDDITGAAGVGRRTFFRYFRGKEDAISPDHETALARITEILGTAHPDEPAPSLVLRAGETVFDLYTDDPALSVARFRLVHEVAVLRDREAASVDHYRRLFTRYLRRRFARDPNGDLRAAVTGSAVVAAHNLALRTWLTDGAPADGVGACLEHFRRVADMLPSEVDVRPPAERLGRAVVRLERGAGA